MTRTDGSTEYDLFISYHRADKEKVMPIYRALRDEGLRVWIDETDVSDYTSITRSIVDGLSRSKALLAYYSHTYPQRRACQWELTAVILASGQEAGPTRRILVINPEEGVEHIHPAELRDAKFHKIPADAGSDEINKITASVKAHVTRLKSLIGDIRAFKPLNWYGTRKGFGSNRFVGRLPYMWKIHSALTASGFPLTAGSKAESSVAQVHGMGGVGKSLLVLEYALRYGAAFPGGIFWLSAFGNDDAKEGMGAEDREAERTEQIRGIATVLDISVHERSPEEIEGHLKRELEQRGEPFLWVVDDLPAGMDRDTLERWLAPHPLGKTIITTRTREHVSLGTLICLDVLKPDEAYELLTSQRRPKGTEEADAARKLLKDLGYHALAVDVAGAALQASLSSTPFVDFINDLADPTNDELEFASELTGTLPIGHETSIAGTFLRSIEKTGPNGQDFLRLASMLATAPIPASLVISVFCEADGLSDESGKRKATRAIHSTEKLSLAERVEGDDAALLVHTLVSRIMRFRDPLPERSRELHDVAVKILMDEFRKKAALDMTRTDDHIEYDIFLSYASIDAEVVKEVANRLRDAKFNVWLDKWVLVGGDRWQQAISKALNQAKSCAVCIGKKTPKGWFREEIEYALNRQTVDDSFRVIPVLLPNSDDSIVKNSFLGLRTWVDFKDGIENKSEFDRLIHGIMGKSLDRRLREEHKYEKDRLFMDVKKTLMQIQELGGIISEELAEEYKRKLLDRLIDKQTGE